MINNNTYVEKNFVPTKEYVSSNPYYGLKVNTLSQSIDDVPGNPDKLWKKMLNDPKIAKSIYIIKIRVLGKGLEILPRYSESHPEYENAATIANFCRILIDELERPLRSTLEQMLDGVVYGHKIAEITWKTIERGDYSYFLPTKIKVKANNLLHFTVDKYNNVIGFGFNTAISQDSLDSSIQPEEQYKITGNKKSGFKIKVNDKEFEFFEKDKFMYFTFKPTDDDPRGQSILRAAYNSWKLKQEIYPEYLRYLLMCAIPLLVGITPENEEPIKILKDKDGNILTDSLGNIETISSVEALMQALSNARNATAIAVKGGTKVEEVGAGAANGGGSSFYNAFEFLNQEIEDSILLQTLATSQGVYQSKSSSQIHMSTLDEFISNIKQQLIDMVVESIFKKAIINNYGIEYLKYLPTITLGDNERRDFSRDATAVAALEKVGWFTDDQKIKIDAQVLNLPPRQSSNLDSNLTTTESLALNKQLLDQELLLHQVEEAKQSSNLKKIEQLLKLRESLTEQVKISDASGNEKVSAMPINLDNTTVKKIDSAIAYLSDEFLKTSNAKPEVLARLGDFKKLVDSSVSQSSEKVLEVDENYYPTKTNIIKFSDRLKKLFNVASIDF